MHKHFIKPSRTKYIKNIKFYLDLNNYCYSDSELNSYTKLELKIIHNKLRHKSITFAPKMSIMYRSRY